MGDLEDARPLLVAQGVDPLRDVLKAVDVQSGVDLVEHRDLGFEHCGLEHLVLLFLAAGEAGVQVPLGEPLVHVQQLHLLAQDPLELGDADLALVDGTLHRAGLEAGLLLLVAGLLVSLEQFLALLELGVQRRPKEVHHRHALDFGGVLEPQVDPQGRPLVGFEVEEIPRTHVLRDLIAELFALQVEGDPALGDAVGWVASDDLPQRRFPATVRPHQGVYLPGVYLQVDAVQDRLRLVVCDLRVEVLDL